jgi:hypothetical protein
MPALVKLAREVYAYFSAPGDEDITGFSRGLNPGPLLYHRRLGRDTLRPRLRGDVIDLFYYELYSE